MKKIIYLLFLLGCYSAINNKLYSQSEQGCFFSKKNRDGIIEKTLVTLVKKDKEISVDIKKKLIKGGIEYNKNWKMNGTIEGDIITFIVPQQTLDALAKDANPIEGPKPIETWIYSNNQLVVYGNYLTSGSCR